MSYNLNNKHFNNLNNLTELKFLHKSSQKIFKKFLYHLLTSGVIISVLLLILELISYNANYVEIFAFLSGSFFIINFFQFYTIGTSNIKVLNQFLVQSIIGGLIWVLYAVIQYILNIFNFGLLSNIFYTLLIIITITLTHIYLVIKKNFYKKLY
jgi:hypothetical protein